MKDQVPKNIKFLAEESVKDLIFGLSGMKMHVQILPESLRGEIDFQEIETDQEELTQSLTDLENESRENDEKYIFQIITDNIKQEKEDKKTQMERVAAQFDQRIEQAEFELARLKSEKEDQLNQLSSQLKSFEQNARKERDLKVLQAKEQVAISKEKVAKCRDTSMQAFTKAVNLYEAALVGHEREQEILAKIIRRHSK